MPPEYINKLSQMFKDIKVSDGINQKFKNVARYNLNNNNLAGELDLTNFNTQIALVSINRQVLKVLFKQLKIIKNFALLVSDEQALYRLKINNHYKCHIKQYFNLSTSLLFDYGKKSVL